MDPSKVLEFSRLLGALKHLKRTGWVKKDVGDPETVASHMYRMASLALLLDKTKVDRDRCIRMCLVHDMGESIVGDITPHCGVSAQDKHTREKAALQHLASLVGEEVGAELVSLWEEYEEGKTAEALAVKELDKFDMIAQAAEYEQAEGQPGRLQVWSLTSLREVGAELVSLWEEYEEGKTAEALAVKELDKFDMIAQAAEYEQTEGRPGRLQEFFDTTPMQTFSGESGVSNWVHALAEERFHAMKEAPVHIIGEDCSHTKL